MDKFVDLLTKAAESIGLEALRIWPQIVGITFVTAIAHLVIEVVAIYVSWRIAMFATQAFQKAPANYEPVFEVVGMVLGWCFFGIALIITAAGFAGDLAAIFFPEATTVMRLISK